MFENQIRNEIELSIVILTHNRKEKVSRCIDCCLSNKIECDYEIIVIDNHSNDGTKELLESRYSQEIRYYYMDENLGSPQGRNKGFSFARGIYVLFLDDDIYFMDEGAIGKLLNIKKHNEAVLVLSSQIFDILQGKLIPFIEPRQKKHNSLNEILSFHGAVHIVKKSDFGNMIYKSRVKFGFEELMLSISIVDRGFTVAYTNEVIAMHDGPRFEFSRERQATTLKTSLYTKKSLYPLVFGPLIMLMHFLRCIKYFGLDYKQIITITTLDIEIDNGNRIAFNTLFKLLRNYRFTKIF